MNLEQLTMNVNLHRLQPNFLNCELYYIIASNENEFRFAAWNDQPQPGEEKYYCFLQDQPLHIPAGNIDLKESYVLSERPPYPIMQQAEDFIAAIDQLAQTGVSKAIRCFDIHEMDQIRQALDKHYGSSEEHLVRSDEAQHQLVVVNNVEISIAATMVYFRRRVPITQEHYDRLKEEEKESKED